MRFSFLHAADLHLGSPLSGLATKNEDIARRFAAASREAFTALVTQAVEAGVAFVLIAGDIYDGDWKDTSIGLFFNREVARLDRAGIPVFIIRGNHDAESEITKAVSLPASVWEFPTRKADTARLEEWKVAIHGRSFADRVVSENIALAYPAPVPGWLNIGMLHTSCESPGAHAVYAPCSIQDLVSRGYDYWALGHVHERAVLHEDPWVVYPGNLQGRSVRECGPKGAVLVDVADGRIEGVRPLVLDRARWLNLAVPVDGARDEAGVLEAVSDAARLSLAESGDRLSAVRVTLTGDTPLHAALKSSSVHLRDEIQAHLHRLHEDAWLETLRIATGEPPSRSPAPDAETRVDAASLLAGMEHDPEIRARAESLLALVAGKIPGGVDNAALPDLDTLLADARATAIGRAMLAEGR
jgi:DNA repair exonuclease SbcCD nuclease subunit